MSIPLEGLSSRAIVLRKQVMQTVTGELKAMEPSGLAGDDASLKSVWEEICAQVQGEESPEWHAYIQTIESTIEIVIETLQPEENCALWLYTDAGDRWIDENLPSTASQIDSPIFNLTNIVSELTIQLLSSASDYESRSLSRFLNGNDYDADEYEEDEEDWPEDDDAGSDANHEIYGNERDE